jgi:hypothetical protein
MTTASPSLETEVPITTTKPELSAAFRVKILGIRNYPSNKGEFSVDDFLDLKILEDFLQEVLAGESDITPAGKAFLERYYGFAELASRLSNTFREDAGLSTAEEVQTTLEGLVPMETMRFVEEARSNIKAGVRLREDLLPPDAS